VKTVIWEAVGLDFIDIKGPSLLFIILERKAKCRLYRK
jgi:hypothetical protein